MKVRALILLLFILQYSIAQNIGINQQFPTNTLHITPVTLGNHPLRIEGIQAYTVSEDTSILVIDPTNGIVKYMSSSELSSSIINNSFISNLGDSLISNSTFINNFGDSLFLSQNFIDSLISNIYNNGDTLLTNTTFITNLGDTLINNNTFITNLGNSLLSNSTFVSNFGDSLFLSQNFIDSLTSNIYNNGDTLLYNTSFINNLRDSIDSDVDSVKLNGSTLTIYENGNTASADLSTLDNLPSSATTGQVLTWNGTAWIAQNASSGADNWGSQNVVTGNGLSGNGTTGSPLVNTFTEIDGSITNEIQNISLNGTTLSISSGNNVNLSSIQDGIGTDNQNISGSGLSGSTLTIGIQNGTNQTVNLSSLINDADASTTNELQTLSQTGLNVTLSNGGGTVSINDNDWTISGTDLYSSVSGNVGIGVTNPSYKLQVNGDIYANGGWLRVSGNKGLFFQTHGGGLYMTDATWIRTYGSKSFYHDTGNFRTDGTLQVGSSGATLNVPSGGNFAYRSSVLFANTAGRVGIGTSSPSRTLDVNGSARIRSISTTTSTAVSPLYVDGSGNVYKKSPNIGTGPKFISPVIVYNSTSATSGFVTFNAAPYIPAGATAIIVEAYCLINGSTNQTTITAAHQKRSYIRKDASSPQYNVLRNMGWTNTSTQTIGISNSQGTYPCTSSRTFQYSAMDFNGGLKIRLIGYY